MTRYFLRVDGHIFGDIHSTGKAARQAAAELKTIMPDAVVEIRGIRP